MSPVLLIDGYNVIAPVAAPGRGITTDWLAAERHRLLQRLIDHLAPTVRERTCVVFDAKNAPRDQPDRYNHHGIDVRFAVDFPEADDLLEKIISEHPSPKILTVVSSDHRIQTAGRRRRTGVYDSDEWLDRLLEGRVLLKHRPKPKPNSPTTTQSPPLPPKSPSRKRSKTSQTDDIASQISDEALEDLIRKHQ